MATERAIFGLVAINFELDESVGLDRKFDGTATAIDERSSSNNASSGFLNDVNGFFGGPACSPNILNDEDVLVRLNGKAATKGHDAAAVALDEESRDAAAEDILRSRERTGHFLPDDDAAERRGDHEVDASVRKKSGESVTEFFGEAGVLENECALNVGVAMTAAGKLEVAVADGSGGFEETEQMFACRHRLFLRDS